MSSVTLYRASGLALLLGAVFAIIGTILSFVFTSGTLSLVITGTFASGVVLQLLGSPSIVARQAPRAGWLGFVGFLLLFLAWLLLASFIAVLRLTIFPWLAVHAPQVGAQLFSANPALIVYTNLELLLVVVGGVLLGMATMRARVLPQWAGLLLIVGAVLNPIGLVNGMVGEVAGVLVVLGLGWMGYALLSAKGEAVPQPVLAS